MAAVTSPPSGPRLPQLLGPAGRWAGAACGMVVLGVGVAAILAAGLGAGPFDVVLAAISDRFALTFAVGGLAVHGTFAVLATLLGRRPSAAGMATVLLVGPTIDVTLPALTAVGGRWLLPVGVAVFAVGLAGYLQAGVGQAPVEATMVALEDRKVPRWAARGALDVGMLAVGLVAGGPVGAGTVFAAVATGPAVAGASWLLAWGAGAVGRPQPDVVPAAA